MVHKETPQLTVSQQLIESKITRLTTSPCKTLFRLYFFTKEIKHHKGPTSPQASGACSS